MKKSFLLMGALCVGAAFVSCVDDSESSEVKELRQVQLDSKKADLDNQYWTMYNNAVTKVKTYQGDLKDNQQNLDDAKDGKLTLDAAKAAAVAYQQMVIARNEKDIADKKAEIEVQKAMKGKSYEEIAQAKITANNAKEEATKEYNDYWINLTEKGYNKDINSKTIAISGSAGDKISMLLDAPSTGNYKYKNNKLDEIPFVKAMNTIFDSKEYYYEYDGNQYSSTYYDFSYDGDSYEAAKMFKSKTFVLDDENGKQITTYTVWYFDDVKQNDANTYAGALSKLVKDATDSEKARLTKLQEDITNLTALLADRSAYQSLIDEYVGHAKKLYSLSQAYASADAIATAYSSYTASNNESTVATLEDAIKTYNTNIENANKAINETINNGITDKETLIAYYNNLISELKSAIAANQAIAEKYRALIAGSSSSNNQQQQQTPAPEETPAE
ncbi:MAG: hypothetical protein J6X32_06225 [Salinivirgaceae bacterium]|nr:hypothetical protein [Salinivirgaceae bacterium]